MARARDKRGRFVKGKGVTTRKGKGTKKGKASAKFEIKGDWEKLEKSLDPNAFKQRLENEIRQATKLNAQIVQKRIRAKIRGNKYSPNAALTILVKSSSKPLVDDGDLFQAITHKVIDDKTAFVGVLKATTIDGQKATDIALALHEGAKIQVTESMRNLFWLLWRVGQGIVDPGGVDGRAAELVKRLGERISSIRPIGKGTSVIVIPPRPFLVSVLQDKQVLSVIRKNWEDAVQKAIGTNG